MTEETHRSISIRLQKIGMIGALVGAGLALWQYRNTSQKQFEAPIWEKQVELYASATETIGRLAYTNDQKEWHDARLRFWELYAGSLILVEDDAVQSGMVHFGKKVTAIGDDLGKRGDSFKQDAIDLSYIFRESIKKSVGASLPALTSKE